jgi:hypothetical protein
MVRKLQKNLARKGSGNHEAKRRRRGKNPQA